MTCTTDPLDTPLTLVIGDSAEYLFTLQELAAVEGDPAVPFDLTQAVDGTSSRRAIVRFAVKSDPDVQSNDDATVYKESYVADEVSLLAQSGLTLGQCLVQVDKVDTEGAFADDYFWDLECCRQDAERTGASQVGTITLVAGSKTVVGVGTAFLKAKLYDILQPLGTNLNNPAIITKILSDTQIEVAHSEWSNDAGASFEIRRSRTRTLMGGTYTLTNGVVAK